MNKEEFIGKLQMVYVGDRNAFNEIVSVYDNLQQEKEDYKSRCEKAIELYENDDYSTLADDMYKILQGDDSNG